MRILLCVVLPVCIFLLLVLTIRLITKYFDFNYNERSFYKVRMNFNQWKRLYDVNPATYVCRYGDGTYDTAKHLYALDNEHPGTRVQICFDFISFLNWKRFWKHLQDSEYRKQELQFQTDSLKSLRDIVQRDIEQANEEMKRMLKEVR